MSFDTRLGAGIRQLGDTDSYRMLRGKDLDITEADALTTLEDADIFLVDEAAAGTQASTNKITAANVKTYMQSGLSSGITFSGSTANGLVTFGDSSTANVESNLLYDSSVYHMQLRAGLQGFPRFDLVTDNEASAASIFSFALETQSLANLDQLGTIDFKGGTDYSTLGGGGTGNSFCYIQGSALDVTNGSEAGRLDLRVSTNGSANHNGIRLEGSNSSDIVNTTIGTGATSLTTVAGNLTVVGDIISSKITTSAEQSFLAGNLSIGAHDDEDRIFLARYSSTFPHAHIFCGLDANDVTTGFKIVTKNNATYSDALVINGSNKAATFSGNLSTSAQLTVTNNINANGNIVGDSNTNITGINGLTATTGNFTSTTSVTQTANNIYGHIRSSRIGTTPGKLGGLCEQINEGLVYGGGNLTAGRVYYLTEDNTSAGTPSWREATAANTLGGSGLLAIALGTSPTDGMVLRGMIIISSTQLGNKTPGDTLFLDSATGGRITDTPPSSTGNVQRILGHYFLTTPTDGHSMIHFNPSQEFITIA